MQRFLSLIKTKKPLLIIVIGIVILILLRIILLQKPNTDIIYSVQKEDLVDTIQVSGTYQTASQTHVVSPANGIIKKLSVKNGDTVKKGDPLFHVESTATEEQQKAANAAYLAASSTLKASQAELYSLQSMMYDKWKIYTDIATNSTFENDDGSPDTENRVLTEFTTVQNDWLAAEANLKNQQAVIGKNHASLASAKQQYDQTQSVTVKAPVDGTIVNLLSTVGDEVHATNPLTINGATVVATPAKAVLTVANLTNPYLSTDINEEYAARVTDGQPAKIIFDAMKNQTVKGAVANTATIGVQAQGIVTYPTRIELAKTPKHIKPGMTALITIETLRKNNVLAVPNSALIIKDDTLYVQTTTKRLLPVQIGIQGASKTEILDGISPGTKIIANPNTK